MWEMEEVDHIVLGLLIRNLSTVNSGFITGQDWVAGIWCAAEMPICDGIGGFSSW